VGPVVKDELGIAVGRCHRHADGLAGGKETWDSCPEVIHIEQILGNYQNNP
jgi:hypothetical protein